MTPVTTSVVICVYTAQRWDDLVAAVSATENQSRPPEQVVVVVDHNPELFDRATIEFPRAEVIPSTGPKGLSGARNTAIPVATGEIVVFLDDDAVPDSQWLETLSAPYNDSRVLGVGGAANPAWDTGEPTWWPREFNWVVGCSYIGQPEELATVRNMLGCNMSMRRSVLKAVGGFDTGLGRTSNSAAGCEETEWCIRATASFPEGHFLYEPAAIVSHRVPAGRARWSYFRSRCYAEGASKARVTRTVGLTSGLSTERSYVRRTLPAGVLRNIGQTSKTDRAGVNRAGAIIAGLFFTASGFLRARLDAGSRRAATQTAPPVIPLILDLEDPMSALSRLEPDMPYLSAWCLVRRDGKPVAKIRIAAPAGETLTQKQIVRELESASIGRTQHEVSSNLASSHPSVPGVSAAVVIATRNRPDQLSQCLDSILKGTQLPDKIIVVDNAPSDNRTAEMMAMRAETDARMEYVREDRPGLANAHNAALPFTTEEIMAFTDDDVVVDRSWLEWLTGAFNGDERTACVTGLIAPLELETLPQQWVEGNNTYNKGLQKLEFVLSESRESNPLLPYASGACGSGANMAFRTAYLRKAGGFDSALGTGTPAMGGDDLAAFHDVLKTGHRLVYEPAAVVLHPHHRDYSALRRQAYGYGAGLGAHLTRCLLRDPRMLPDLFRQIPALRLRGTSILLPSAVADLPAYPGDLSRAHFRGLLSGSKRYLQSRRQFKRTPVGGTAP